MVGDPEMMNPGAVPLGLSKKIVKGEVRRNNIITDYEGDREDDGWASTIEEIDL